MKLGAEPKKLVILGGLLLVAVYALFFMGDSTSSSEATPTPAPATPVAVSRPPLLPATAPRAGVGPRAGGNVRAPQELRPTLRRRPEDRIDPATIDPTLRLDLLAKLQTIKVQGGERNLFEFGTATAPPAAAPVKIPQVARINPTPIGPQPEPPPAPPAPPPPPPAIPLRFFGYTSPVQQGAKQAFFVDGEDIQVVAEGDLIKRRYRIIRIGTNAVVVEDTQFKNQQTLPLEEAPPNA